MRSPHQGTPRVRVGPEESEGRLGRAGEGSRPLDRRVALRGGDDRELVAAGVGLAARRLVARVPACLDQEVANRVLVGPGEVLPVGSLGDVNLALHGRAAGCVPVEDVRGEGADAGNLAGDGLGSRVSHDLSLRVAGIWIRRWSRRIWISRCQEDQ
ncbi:hypothetical protein ACFPRL_27230 [Pseudoclavibacter helvolus]